ncbi:3'-5' ssDNA/RNA exonuclease TatD-like [Argiope bruennichi]|uniref:Deoxyribonuclease TATDN1 n=1 Tax=Argiope bruennichi TaxID=94029 RepID=A0A8T0FYU3_ARGBR|nr:3'-5' ssDNA/RNA exonuclease TatD-like [Argiope bruennichi]XP_055948547.1 3'-5' ssDNA/RNA exonuclease TatD-like [Argiope bruennichi]KAF8796201.1 3'-5' ssDNA/RNA exonuclease TatD like protein [Argiope bruennichi]
MSCSTSKVVKDSPRSSSDLADALEDLSGQYFITDVSANLTNKKFARDVDGVIERAQNAGVKKIIVSGTNIQSSKEALRLTRIFPDYIYCAAGIHPNEAKSWDDDIEASLRGILSNPECVAVGQCGLDYTKKFSEPAEQKEVLNKQLKIAAELKMPILICEREAHEDLIEILKNNIHNLPEIIIHSFCGKINELNTYLSFGCYIGLTGSIWKDKSEDGLKKILEDQMIPLDRLLIESDSPYMYPNTRASHIPANIKETLTEKSLSFLHRYCTFQRNEPCSLPVTVELIAANYKTKPDEIALQTTFCAMKLFGLN